MSTKMNTYGRGEAVANVMIVTKMAKMDVIVCDCIFVLEVMHEVITLK